MSCPEIAIHKKYHYGKRSRIALYKRTQKDYSMSFKLQIVQEIEQRKTSISQVKKDYAIQSRSTIVQWLRKLGNFDWDNQTPFTMSKSPEQKIMELDAKVKLLEKQKAFLEQQAYVADKKAIIFDMMIDIAEKEYQIDSEKTHHPNNRPF